MRGSVLVLLLAVTPWAASLAAQDAADTAAQLPMRARIQQQGVKPQRIGVITRYDADSLHLRTAGGDVAIAQSAVIRIQASRGMHSNLTKGLVRGVAIGGGAGFLLGALALVAKEENSYLDYGSEVVPIGAAMGGVLGGLIGAGIGALSHSERWETVSLDEVRVSLHVAPSHTGTRLGLSVQF